MNTPAQCGVIKPPKTDIYSEAPHASTPRRRRASTIACVNTLPRSWPGARTDTTRDAPTYQPIKAFTPQTVQPHSNPATPHSWTPHLAAHGDTSPRCLSFGSKRVTPASVNALIVGGFDYARIGRVVFWFWLSLRW